MRRLYQNVGPRCPKKAAKEELRLPRPRNAVLGGSFDPITLGHLEIVEPRRRSVSVASTLRPSLGCCRRRHQR
ncbi:hypothetical protein ACNOYE_27925 [Nannocystaceae bacterium ST9]